MSDRASPTIDAPETSGARPSAIVAKITSFYNRMERAAL
jgi:hypothetical protein